jgi:hypothetical protein
MTKPAESHEASGRLALYEKLVATVPGIDRRGATIPYTSLNGHMFSMLTRAGTLALRLPEPARAELLKKYKTTLVEQHGVVQKEYVTAPETLLAQTRVLSKYFQISIDYVRGLKPRPTKGTKASSGDGTGGTTSGKATPKARGTG